MSLPRPHIALSPILLRYDHLIHYCLITGRIVLMVGSTVIPKPYSRFGMIKIWCFWGKPLEWE